MYDDPRPGSYTPLPFHHAVFHKFKADAEVCRNKKLGIAQTLLEFPAKISIYHLQIKIKAFPLPKHHLFSLLTIHQQSLLL